MMTSLSTLIAFVVACTGLAVSGAPAQAQAQEGIGFMRLGLATPPPPGFVAMCEADPAECPTGTAAPFSPEQVRTWASRVRWERTFAEAGIALSSAAPATVLVPSTPSASASADVGTAMRHARFVEKLAARKAAGRVRTKATAMPSPSAGKTPPKSSSMPGVQGSEVGVRDLERVNRRINRAIRRSSDQETFGAADVWATPSGPRARGDCEDYALAKRRALIAEGVDPDRLALAIVRTRGGEVHAVLLATTAEGDYVLDNLSPWVVRWDRAPYEWVERQVSGRSLEWASLATTL